MKALPSSSVNLILWYCPWLTQSGYSRTCLHLLHVNLRSNLDHLPVLHDGKLEAFMLEISSPSTLSGEAQVPSFEFIIHCFFTSQVA